MTRTREPGSPLRHRHDPWSLGARFKHRTSWSWSPKSKFHFLLHQKVAETPLGGTIAYILKFQIIKQNHISNPAAERIAELSSRSSKRQHPTSVHRPYGPITEGSKLVKYDFLGNDPTHIKDSLPDSVSISIVITISMQCDVLKSSFLHQRWIASNCHSLLLRG